MDGFTNSRGNQKEAEATSRSPDPASPTTGFSGSSRRLPIRKEEPTQKTVHVTLFSMNGLMDVMVTLSRIGATIDYVSAKTNSAIFAVTAKPFVIRRIPQLLNELVEVTSLNEL